MSPDVLNIHTPAGGLLETHLTWEDVEEIMQNKLDTKAIFGPNKSVTNVGENNGFMSRICLVDADWQNVEDGKDLPKKFIVKACTQLTMLAVTKAMAAQQGTENIFEAESFVNLMEEQTKILHNVEVTVYTHLLKDLPEGKIPIPRIYHMEKFTKANPVKGYIVMDYIENVLPIHIYKNVKPTDLKEPLRILATIQAMALKFNEEEKKQFSNSPFVQLFEKIFTPDAKKQTMAMFRRFNGGILAEKADIVDSTWNEMLDMKRADRISEIVGLENVLCHGDLWSMNLLWHQDGEELKLAALLDYQIAHYGNPAADLVRLFCSTLSGKDRREHWEELCEQFYDMFLQETEGQTVPYTLEQLKQAYRIFFPMGGFLVLMMVGPIVEVVQFQAKGEPSEDVDVGTEKTVALLDDVIDYHAKYGAIN